MTRKSIDIEIEEQKKLILDRFGVSNDRQMHEFINNNIIKGQAINNEAKRLISEWGKYQALFTKREWFIENVNNTSNDTSNNSDASPKDKIIRLYKAFLSNKKYKIYDKHEHLSENQAFVLDYDNTYWRTRRHTHEYFIKGDILNDDDKDMYDTRFLESDEEIKTHVRHVEIRLSKHPRIILKENTEPVATGSDMKRNIPFKGWRRFFNERYDIEFVTFESKTTRTLSFGKIEIELSETDFNELFTFADNMMEHRDNEIDEAKLNARLSEYNA